MSRQIRILGPLSITDYEQPSDLLRNAKGCALLVYLLVRGRSETREHLADLLWEAVDASNSLRNLRSTLNRIRSHLPGLEVDHKTLHYLPQPDEVIDYLTLTERLSGKEQPITLDDLRLYRGELLEGFYLEDAPRFMDWLTVEREKVRQSVLDAHRDLCRSLAEGEHWGEGAEAAAHWLAIDELDEEALRYQLQFLAEDGQVTAAMDAYAAFRKRLWDHLGLEPEEATQKLAQALDDWSGEVTAFSLAEVSSLEALTSGDLSEPGLLPPNAILPYHRNDDFIGRETDLLEMAAALGEAPESNRPPVLALTGIGGMGKTQTAVEFCYRYGRYFPGGVFWMNFEVGENAAEEVAAVGSERGLGLFREAEQLSLEDQIGRVQRAWQEPVPRLLVFDNCEEKDLLETWLPTSGGCRVLLTSRRAEWPREFNVTCLPLDVLGRSESIHLLQSLAPELGQREADEMAAEIGDLPLAIHLAGSFLQRYRQISPADYLAQLRDESLLRHPSLQGHGSSYSPTGHELSVARTYALSWEQLDPGDEVDALARQLLLCAACLAPGEPIPAEWLKATVNGEGNDMVMTILAEDGLSRLVALGFLRKEGQTVVLHPLLASFTSEMSGEKEKHWAQMAVGTLMAGTLSEYRQMEGHLSILPISSAHVRYVSEKIGGQHTPITATLFTQLGYHLDSIGNVIEAEQILKKACDVASNLNDPLGHARALTALGNTQEALGHDNEVLQSVNQAISLFKETGQPDIIGLTEALYYQGWAHYRLGQAKQALSTAREGYKLSHDTNLHLASGHFLNLMGVVNYYMLGKYNVAKQNLEEGLVAYREVGNRQGESSILNNMGESARLQGDFVAAVRYYEEAVTIARETENQNKEDIFLSNLCGARIRLGQFKEAEAGLEALIMKIRHDWYGLSEAYRFLGEAYLGQGKTAQALEMAQQALSLAYPSNLFEHGRAWRVLGLVATQLGEPIRSDVESEQSYDAAACFRRSLDFFKEGEYERDRAITLWRWAQCEIEQENKEQGQTMWQEAKDIFARLNLPLMAARMETDNHNG